MTSGCPHCGAAPANQAERPKGGRFAKEAAMLCQNAEFRRYLDWRLRKKYRLDIPDGTHTEEDARQFILRACGIDSRAELDSSLIARQWFLRIRRGFMSWRRGQALAA